MFKPINGWTKERILEVIKARTHDGPSICTKEKYCVYKAIDGNKCAVGLFIPEGHPGQTYEGTVKSLVHLHPDLRDFMPLDIRSLHELQRVHDTESPYHESDFQRPFDGNAKSAMIDWVEKYVRD